MLCSTRPNTHVVKRQWRNARTRGVDSLPWLGLLSQIMLISCQICSHVCTDAHQVNPTTPHSSI